MRCESCRDAKAAPKGSKVPGYCDACGWALALDGSGRELPKLRSVSPFAILAVSEVKILTGPDSVFPIDWYGRPEVVGAAVREAAAEVKRRSSMGGQGEGAGEEQVERGARATSEYLVAPRRGKPR